MAVFGLIGWGGLVIAALLVMRAGFGLLVFYKGFTGRCNWWAVTLIFSAMAVLFVLFNFAPIHISLT